MIRKLFAFLALLTGLVALSGTASVSFAQSSSPCNTGVSASAECPDAGEQAKTKVRSGKPARGPDSAKPQRKVPTPPSLRMPVLMGIDRAYE